MTSAIPIVDMQINGVGIGQETSQSIVDFTWTDNLHGKADEIATTLCDPVGLWRGPWRPEQGDLVRVSIGYEGQAQMPCGIFEIDIPDASGSRGNDQLQFKATSAFESTDQRSQKSKGNEETSLKKMSADIAGRHGYGLSGDIDDMDFAYKRQRREHDLSFVRRLGEDYGHFVGLKDRQIVFHRRDKLEAAPAVRTIEIAELSTGTEWSARDNSNRTFSNAKVQYLDPNKKELIKAEVSDSSVKGNNTLKIDERVESPAQAERLAKGRLAKANEDKRTANLTLVGDVMLIAGVIVELGPTFGKYQGRYLVHTATHSIRRANYTTALELKGV
ncbi:phage late control D family protein [Maritalea porphyrae]|uniref:phage late control D family protein n=1 Tax=Maritalea porphyrae TaxID=880732 RepID=UPI0022AE6B7F|nr:contractile injection system protein, VgrG/Pvc8 family [Maritalea porphyrae]MCZ4273298.1 contractile injection system protein, VgrG/Pvc8 family [Maritalea porphyrae]